MKKSLIAIAALLLLTAGCSGTDEANDADTSSSSEPNAEETADAAASEAMTAEGLHAQLASAGIQCDPPVEYVPAEDELNFGVTPDHAFDCENDSIGAAVFADEPQRVAMQGVASDMVCSFGAQMTIIADANWWIGSNNEEPDLELLERVSKAVGIAISQSECD